jgi:hypothetical protein
MLMFNIPVLLYSHKLLVGNSRPIEVKSNPKSINPDIAYDVKMKFVTISKPTPKVGHALYTAAAD